MRRIPVITAVMAVLLLTACGRMHRTAGHKNTGDTVDIEAAYQLAAEDEPPVVRDLTRRQKEAIQAENEVMDAIKADTGVWVAHEFNWWYRYTSKGDTHREDLPFSATIADGTVLHEQICTLDGQLLLDAVRPCEDEEPFVYERMVPYLVKGDTLLMIVPWYMAFDDKGTEYVPPKTNVRITLTVE